MNDILIAFVCIVLIYIFGEAALASKGIGKQHTFNWVPLNYTVYDAEEEE